MKRFLFVVGAICVLAASAYGADIATLINQAGLEQLKAGTKIVDFKLDDLSGNTVKLSSYHGDVVVLNFWASWCGPCRSEMPALETLYTRFKDKGLVVLGVNLQESKSSVESFVQREHLTFPVLLDKSGRVGYTYGARSIPLTYIINRQGEVTSGAVGAREWTSPATVALIKALLKQDQ